MLRWKLRLLRGLMKENTNTRYCMILGFFPSMTMCFRQAWLWKHDCVKVWQCVSLQCDCILTQHDCIGYDCTYWLRSLGQYASALNLLSSLSRYVNCLPSWLVPLVTRSNLKSEYKADSNIGCDSLLLISTVHYFIMFLLHMAFDDSQGPTLTQWLMER